MMQTPAELQDIETGCRTAGIGCVDCKRRLLTKLEAFQAPIRARKALALASGRVDDVIAKGNAVARAEAQKTMQRVREAMGL